MLFRPEEVHGASGKGKLGEPFSKRDRDVAHDAGRVRVEDDPVTHLDVNGLSTIEAGGIDRHFSTGYEPADRQRFEASLAVPSVLAVDADVVLGG